MLLDKVKACAQLVRVINSIMVGFAVLVGLGILYGRDLPSVGATVVLLSFSTGFFISASAMVLNDIADIEIDRVNAPNRPLVRGDISIRVALVCHFIFALAGVFSSALIGMWPLIIAVAGWILSAFYDLWGKKSGFPGNFLVALATSLPFPYALAVAGRIDRSILVYWTMVFLTVLGREIVKDIADVEGDRVAGVSSLPIIIGERSAAVIAGILYLSAVTISPLPVLWSEVSFLSYIPLVAIVDVILVSETIRIIRRPDRENAVKSKSMVLLAMLIGLIAFLTAGIVGR